MSTYEFFGLDDLARQHDDIIKKGESYLFKSKLLGPILDKILNPPHTGSIDIYEKTIEQIAAFYKNKKIKYALALLEVMSVYDNDPFLQVAINFDDRSVKINDIVPEEGVWFTQRVNGIIYLFRHPDKNFKIKYGRAICYGRSSDIYAIMRRQKMVNSGILKR